MPRYNKPRKELSFWEKIKSFLSSLTGHQKNETSEDDDRKGGSSGTGKPRGKGFIDPKAATLKDLQGKKSNQQYVKNLETILYDELKKDPAAMKALKELVNGQIPVAQAQEAYEQVRNSTIALEALANSEYTPSDIKNRAREELLQLQRKKFAAQPGFKKEPPKPRF